MTPLPAPIRRTLRIVDCDNGLQFACLGVVPERRFLLEAVYAFLTLRNGVPIGYALASALFDSSELAFNVSRPSAEAKRPGSTLA